MSGTVIKQHDCASAHQDALYGPWFRVFNIGKAGKTGNTPETCTVCSPNALKRRMQSHAMQHDFRKHGGRP